MTLKHVDELIPQPAPPWSGMSILHPPPQAAIINLHLHHVQCALPLAGMVTFPGSFGLPGITHELLFFFYLWPGGKQDIENSLCQIQLP